MFCNKCGIKIDIGDKFCSNCGNSITTSPEQKKQVKTKNNNLYKKIIIGVLSLIVVTLSVIAVTSVANKFQSDTRTIMIYMSGSNLESEKGIATADLNSIISEEINLEETNVLVYTGGTKKWFNNYIKADENAIYLLEEEGFTKLESYDTENLGDSSTFESFLTYAYENYKAKSYDLIIWNHGLGALGSVLDDYASDFLTVAEMDTALKNSPFNTKNKMEAVIFRTCLNGTAEIASTFAPYSEYMIASEEITFGSSKSNVLSFINQIEDSDNGVAIGKKFIESYQRQMDDIDPFGSKDSTYAIIDLSKMDELQTALDDFFKDIDVKNNYAEIAKIRSNLYQYAVKSANSTDYDTVDLYELITKMSSLSPTKADKILEILDDMITHNWTTDDISHGLAIYFPFNGNASAIQSHMQVYNSIKLSTNYHNFIKTFNSIQNETPTYSFNISKNTVQMNNKEFSLQLTEEQVKNYTKASYIIFEKSSDGYFMPIYSADNATLGEDGVLRTNISDNLVKVVDKKTNEEAYVQVSEISNENNEKEYITAAVLTYFNENEDVSNWKTNSATIHIKTDKNKNTYLTRAVQIDNNSVGGALLDLEDYTTISFGNFKYKILDKNGNYNENWEGSDVKYLFEVGTGEEDYELKTTNLDDKDNYYCIFKVKDIKNKYYYSNLIKVN